ncbi:non-ribosomal peptide synthetase [Flavobacterium sp. N502540]|uniref:non-ribosomal peptide synthetase n=1 Tax=Flavobacterium sp. N502540 TaxID=2986838 RepID=UPI002224721C|nr:non-ribosomal peptide synthetase [Flavobacterium sp. N502540]
MREFLSTLRTHNIHLQVTKGELIVKFPKGEMNQNLLEKIKSNKTSLIDYLTVLNGYDNSSIKVVDTKESYDLSSAQKRLWVLSKYDGGSIAYNIPGFYTFEGILNVSALELALNTLQKRHEILRTSFKEDAEGVAKQFIDNADGVNFKMGIFDLRLEEDRDQMVKKYVQNELSSSFDLSSSELWRANLYRVENNKWIFTYVMHHIITDGWSMDILIKELFVLYNSFNNNLENLLEPLRIQYKDYAAWQQDQLNGESLKEHQNYWLKQFEGPLPILELQADKARPALKTYNGGAVNMSFSAELSKKLKNFAQENGCTLYMTLLAAVKTLLYRYTQQEDIVIGSSIIGRDHSELENQIGFYVNTLALRTRFSGNDSFNELLSKVKQVTLGAYDHQVYPFDELVKNLNIKRDASRSVLFDVMVLFQSMDISNESEDQSLDLLRVNKYEIEEEHVISKFDLAFDFAEIGEGVHVNIEYNSDIYYKNSIEQIGGHLLQLIEAALTQPDLAVCELDYMSSLQKNELLLDFNKTAFEYPADKNLLDLFSDQVLKTPDHTAIVFEGSQYTYQELHNLSNELGDYLRKKYNIRANDLIGIKLDRSEWMVIAILGVLKSGGAYLPIDPEYPQERIDFMTADSGCVTLLDAEELAVFRNSETGYDKENFKTNINQKDLAYVIYTSGSTGRPKGVLIEHGAVANSIQAQQSIIGLSASQRCLQFFSCSFDVSVFEIFLTLLSGSALHIIKDSDKKNPELLENYIQDHNIEMVTLPAAYLPLIYISKLSGLKKVVTGGESVSQDLVLKVSDYVDYYNAYGPTESSICTSIFEIKKGSKERIDRVSIGKPIANTAIYILDAQNRLAAKGMAGEICIGGYGLARGYHNNEALTSEKFIPNPFVEGDRMYKTGDLGRWLSDGTIDFLGRIDDQVKIRGYRIELGEIERSLLSCEGVDAAVVIAHLNANKEKELVAYVLSSKVLHTQDLILELHKILPSYMIPVQFVQLEELPLTSNGKIDKSKLPNPDESRMEAGIEYISARNETEQQLLKVYQEVLKKEDIGVKSDFFVSGGDSIKAIQIVGKIKQLGYTISIQEVLAHPVIEDLIGKIQIVTATKDQEIIEGNIPLSPIQHSFFQSDKPVKNHFNQSVLLVAKERIIEKHLKEVFDKIFEHHDALRMHYPANANGYSQINKGFDQGCPVDVINIEDENEFLEHCDRLQSGFDLEKGPLFRVCLFRNKECDRLLMIAHHLIIDAVSWRVLFEDFSALYEQCLRNVSLSLPAKTDSFKFWMEKQVEYSNSEILKEEEKYWSLQESIQVHKLPMDIENGSNTYENTTTLSFKLDETTTQALLTKCSKTYNTNVNDILITSFAAAMSDLFNLNTVSINLEGHGREYIGANMDVSRTVGWFTTMFPIVLDVSYKEDKIRQLIQVKEYLHRIPNKGLGYGVLKHISGKKYELEPQITFNYFGDFGSGVQGNNGENLFDFSGDHHGMPFPKTMERESLMDVSGMVVNGCLELSIDYSNEQYIEETIANLLAKFKENLNELILKLSTDESKNITPVDLTYKGFTVESLQLLNSDVDIEDIFQVSDMQRILIEEYEKDVIRKGIYHPLFSWTFTDNSFSLNALKSAIDAIQKKHYALRSGFIRTDNGTICQLVKKNQTANSIEKDLSDLSEAEQRVFIKNTIREDIEAQFKINDTQTLASRFRIFKLAEDSFELMFSAHHALLDGWGGAVFKKELLDFYMSFKADRTVDFTVSPNASIEHVILSNKVTKSKDAIDFWHNELQNWKPFKLEENTDTLAGYSTNSMTVPKEVLQKIREQVLTDKTSLKAIYFKSCIETFRKFLNTKNLSVGVVLNGRSDDLVNGLNAIGLFWNILPFCVDSASSLDNKSIQNKLNKMDEFSKFSAQVIKEKLASDHSFISFNFTHFHNSKNTDTPQITEDFPTLINEFSIDYYHYPLNVRVGINPNDEDQVSIVLDYDQAFFSESMSHEILAEYINQLAAAI